MTQDHHESESPVESLLDRAFGELSETRSRELDAALAESAELRKASAGCDKVLAALDAYTVAPPSSDLTERVLNRIALSEALIPFPSAKAGSGLPSGQDYDAVGSPVLSLRELVVIAACITLFVGIFIPGYYKAQDISRRNLCRQNEKQIYAGLVAYEQANAGFLPYADAVPGGSWLRVRTPGVPRASNTRHIYKLVKDEYVQNPRVFVCPGERDGVPMIMDSRHDYRRVDDFAEPANCSYSIQNSNEARQIAFQKLDPRFVYLADANPYFSGPMAHVMDPREVENSNAHGTNAGQNVLALDGSVRWRNRPDVGVDGDHIYRAGNLLHYIGTELPKSPTDSFLVP